MADHIDVKIKSWGNGSTSGPWIKLDLAEEEDLEALKNQIGNGFHMVLIPIDQGDSTPPEEEQEEEQISESEHKRRRESWEVSRPVVQDIPDFIKKRDAAKSAKGSKEKPLSCQAHLMVMEGSFHAFINLTTNTYQVINTQNADEWFKDFLGIDSKRSLDNEEYPEVIDKFIELQKEWRHWVNRREGRQ